MSAVSIKVSGMPNSVYKQKICDRIHEQLSPAAVNQLSYSHTKYSVVCAHCSVKADWSDYKQVFRDSRESNFALGLGVFMIIGIN